MMTCTAKELCAATGGTLVQDGEGFSCVSTDSRRVMIEFCVPEDFQIIAAKNRTDYKVYTLAELLPGAFSPESLGEAEE